MIQNFKTSKILFKNDNSEQIDMKRLLKFIKMQNLYQISLRCNFNIKNILRIYCLKRLKIMIINEYYDKSIW